MSTVNLFELAAREKFRFETNKGLVAVEDLFDLPLTGDVSLDATARLINRQVKALEEESFVETPKAASAKVIAKLEIVKHIIALRKAEVKAHYERVEKQARRAELKALLLEKQKEALKGKSQEEILAELAELDGE